MDNVKHEQTQRRAAIRGTLVDVPARTPKDGIGRSYGRARLLYVNARGEPRSLTILAFGEEWAACAPHWREGREAVFHVRFVATPKGVTLRPDRMDPVEPENRKIEGGTTEGEAPGDEGV